MPVILLPEDEQAWLDPDTPSDIALSLIQPFPTDLMRAYPVSMEVNSPRNNSPELLEEVAS